MSGAKSGNLQTLSSLLEHRLPVIHQWLAHETPWITTGAAAWLEANVMPTDSCVEYGGGRSTLWWAKTVSRVFCVECSAEWAIGLLTYAFDRPDILKNIRIYFSPSEWNPNSKTLKPYWHANRKHLSEADKIKLEEDLIVAEFGFNNIWSFDGSVRDFVFAKKIALVKRMADIIVIDNMESTVHAISSRLALDPTYERLDFIESDPDKIPRWQHGKHITTVFVRPSRLASSAQPTAGQPVRLSEAEWFDYVGIAPEAREDVTRSVLAEMRAWAAHPHW